MADTKNFKKFKGGIRLDASTDTEPSPAEVGAMYVDTNGTLKIYNGSAWDSVGSGAGTTNYISTADSKVDTIANFNLYKDADQVTPEDGTAGSPSVTKTLDATSLLRGLNSLKFSKGASDLRGEGISYDFTIDKADCAKKLLITFDYKTSTAYADDDMAVFIFDDDTDTIIRVSGEDIKATSGTSTFTGQFQTHATSDSYRLIFHVVSENASAYDLYLDNLSVAPQTVPTGAMVTDWEAWTPTGSWSSNTTYTGYKRRVGDTGYYRVDVDLTGAPTSANLSINMPSGEVIDADKLLNTQSQNHLGSISIRDSSEGDPDDSIDGKVFYNSTTAIGAQHLEDSSTSEGSDHITQASPVTFASGDRVTLTWSAPIAGWSANTVMSQDFSGRDVVCTARGLTSDQAITKTTITKVTNWNTPTVDTTGSWDSSNNYFVVPETGYYDMSMRGHIHGEATTGDMDTVIMWIQVDGSNMQAGTEQYNSTASGFAADVGVTAMYLTKGQQVSFGVYFHGGGDVDASNDLYSDAAYTNFSIAKRHSPQTILENETVAARMTASSPATVDLTSETKFAFDTVTFDTHGGFSDTDDDYTIPITGYYQINAHVNLTAGTNAEEFYFRLYIDDAQKLQQQLWFNSVGKLTSDMTDMLYLTKGQTVHIGGQITTGSDSSVTVQESIAVTSFSIAKIK